MEDLGEYYSSFFRLERMFKISGGDLWEGVVCPNRGNTVSADCVNHSGVGYTVFFPFP